MEFNQYLEQAWTDHATDALKVAQTFSKGISLIRKESEVADLAQLMTHVLGQHLAQFDSAIDWLKKLSRHNLATSPESQKFLQRLIVGMSLAAGKNSNLEEFSTSDRIRVLTTATNALSEQKDLEKIKFFFKSALDLAQTKLPEEDPAFRALAITGNNLAGVYSDRTLPAPEEMELMILGAEVARKYWEIAGNWLNVERAEYRLSQVYLKCGDLKRALEHAQTCIEISGANSAPPLELFFGYEALALVEKARSNQKGFEIAFKHAETYFHQLADADKTWCEKSLKALKT